jgi:hypothetical protein
MATKNTTKKSRPTHWATASSAYTACRIAKVAVAVTVRPNDVTCGACKRAIAIPSAEVSR